MNRFFLLCFLILLGTGSVLAQYSLQSQYHTSLQRGEDLSSWPAVSVIDGSLHYWTRLKKYRLEFYPGVLMQVHQIRENDQSLNLGLSVPLAFYPLDFVNDCDCPTFSKNAFWFQKGFFIRITPSWTTNISGTSVEAMEQMGNLGISMGLDFGISDLLTLSPMAGYQYSQSFSVTELSGSFLHFGLSVLFRNDYRKKYR